MIVDREAQYPSRNLQPDSMLPADRTSEARADRDTATQRLVINGRKHPIPTPASIQGALDALGLGGRPVAVELNGRLVRRAEHPDTAVHPGDRVEIVTFVGGG